MNFKYLFTPLYVYVALISIGCSSTLYTQESPTPVKIAMDRYEIRINDLREKIDEGYLITKYFATPGKEDLWTPPFTEQLQNIVHKIIQGAKADGDGDLIFEVNIKAGYKEFIGGFWYLVGKAYCEVITKVVNSDTNKVMKSGQGICGAEMSGVIIEDEDVELMWLQTFERAVIQSINNLQEL